MGDDQYEVEVEAATGDAAVSGVSTGAFIAPSKLEVQVFHGRGTPLRDQIRSFREADIVVGVHGAGLTNIVFCRPGATVLEIPLANRPASEGAYFGHIAVSLGLSYWAFDDLSVGYDDNGWSEDRRDDDAFEGTRIQKRAVDEDVVRSFVESISFLAATRMSSADRRVETASGS